MCRPDFRRAVEQAVGLDCCRPGLQAFRGHRRLIQAHHSRAVAGSVDLDQCLISRYPQDARWDYAVGCVNRLLVFVEVHPNDITGLVRKKAWLDQFLQGQGKPLLSWADRREYYWVRT